MNLSRYIYKTTAGVLAFASLATLTGCASEDFDQPDGQPGTLTIFLGATQTRANADAQNRGSIPALDEERNVNNLRYFLFPIAGSTGTFKSDVLTVPTPSQLSSGVKYTLEDLKSGNYNLYIVANVPEVEDCVTETDFKAVMLDHDSKLGADYKSSGKYNLPMIAEFANFNIDNTKANNIATELNFACVKVSYRLLFYKGSDGEKMLDGKTATARPFGTNGFFINNVTADNLTQEAPVTLSGANLTEFSDGTGTKVFGVPSYSSTWDASSYNVSGKDEITPGAAGNVTLGDKYIVSGVMYLPERYVEDSDNCTTLKFDGYQVSPTATYSPNGTVPTGSNPHTYEIKIGHQESGLSQLARSTYYEVIAEVVNPQSKMLDAKISPKDWTVHEMSGDLSHAELTIDKTKASVTSIERDSIHYEANMAVNFFCDTKDSSNRPIITTYKPAYASPNTIYFRVNSAIPFESFGAGKIPSEGTVQAYLQCGNIRKYIDVTYDVSPLFEVSPEERVIHYDPNDNTGNSRISYFDYSSNLPDASGNTILFDHSSFTFGKRYNVDSNGNLVQNNDGVLLIDFEEGSDSQSAHGQIKVQVMKDPGENALEFEIPLKPGNSSYSYLSNNVKVIVKPPFTTYRIYFRPINDNQDSDDLLDYSSSSGNLYSWSNKGANVYIYSQLGETNGSIPKQNVWIFTKDGYPGDVMTSLSSPLNGWFYFGLDNEKEGRNELGDGSVMKPKPAETLLIYTRKDDQSNTRHRMAFDMEAGIQLFDFEDREGWYIFDPTCSPYNKVYDERPEIVPVKYQIFSKTQVNEVYINYGAATNDHTLKINSWDNSNKKEGTDVNGNTWYVYSFTLQCPQGDYAKSLKVKFNNGTTTTIFGGANYYRSSRKGQANGIYENGSWREGTITFTNVAKTKKTIYLHDTASSKLSKPHIYLWTSSNNKNADWPGLEMESIGNHWWKYEYETGGSNPNFVYFILNKGGNDANQDQSSSLAVPTNPGDAVYYKRTNAKSYSTTTDRP